MKTHHTLVAYLIALFHITLIQGERPEINLRSVSGADTNADVDLGDENSEVIGSGKPGDSDKIDEEYYRADRELGGKSSKSTAYPTMYPTLYPTLAPTWCGKSGKSTSCYSGSWDRKLSRDARDPVRNLNGSGKPGSRDMLVDKAEEEEPAEISSNINARRRINGGQKELQEDKNAI